MAIVEEGFVHRQRTRLRDLSEASTAPSYPLFEGDQDSMRTDTTRYSNFTGWIDRPDDVRPALDGDLTCDIAVVGGGMGGMATALRLAERGQDVVLLESEFCGYGAASRNGGQIAG